MWRRSGLMGSGVRVIVSSSAVLKGGVGIWKVASRSNGEGNVALYAARKIRGHSPDWGKIHASSPGLVFSIANRVIVWSPGGSRTSKSVRKFVIGNFDSPSFVIHMIAHHSVWWGRRRRRYSAGYLQITLLLLFLFKWHLDYFIWNSSFFFHQFCTKNAILLN